MDFAHSIYHLVPMALKIVGYSLISGERGTRHRLLENPGALQALTAALEERETELCCQGSPQ